MALRIESQGLVLVHTARRPVAPPQPTEKQPDTAEISRAGRAHANAVVDRAGDGPLTSAIGAAPTQSAAERVMNELRASFFAVKGEANYNEKVDLNHDGVVNPLDLALAREKILGGAQPDPTVDPVDSDSPSMLESIRAAFFSRKGDSSYSAAADLNGDGVVNVQDLGLARARVEKQTQPETAALESAGQTAVAPGTTPPVVDDQTEDANAPIDMAAFRTAFFARSGDENFNASLDFNDDGVINVQDLGLARARLAESGSNAEVLTPAAQSTATPGATNPELTAGSDTPSADDARSVLTALRDAFFSRRGDGAFNGALDFNNDGVVTVQDLGLFRARLGSHTTQPVPPPVENATAETLKRMIEILRSTYDSD